MTANWTGCDRSLAREFELARKQMLQTAVIHDQHDEIYIFDADLQSPASAAHRDEGGSAPAIRRAAGRDTAPVLTTEYEATFNQIWHYDNALGIAQNFFRDAFVRCGHDGVQNSHRPLHTINGVFACRTRKRVRPKHTHGAHQQHRHYFLHESFSFRTAELRGEDFRWLT